MFYVADIREKPLNPVSTRPKSTVSVRDIRLDDLRKSSPSSSSAFKSSMRSDIMSRKF